VRVNNNSGNIKIYLGKLVQESGNSCTTSANMSES